MMAFTLASSSALVGASTFAPEVDRLFFALLILSLAMLTALGCGVGYFLVRYRAGSKADRTESGRSSIARLELVWTLGTLAVFLGLGVWGSAAYLRMAQPPSGDLLDIYVIGRQWMWEAHHPNGRREHNRIHLPVGQPIRLVLISEDVIHSLFMPAFRLKHDVLPNRYTSLWLEVTEAGTYDLYCAEFCGTEHHRMTGKVIALEPEAYARWSSGGADDDGLAQRGAALFRSFGCSGCHGGNGAVPAPSLAGIYGRRVPLADGSFARVDEAYLHDSIVLPNKQVAAGYAPLMPSYRGVASNEEVFALVEYLKSLSTDNPTAER